MAFGMRPVSPGPDGFPFTLTMADRPALTLYCAAAEDQAAWVGARLWQRGLAPFCTLCLWRQ